MVQTLDSWLSLSPYSFITRPSVGSRDSSLSPSSLPLNHSEYNLAIYFNGLRTETAARKLPFPVGDKEEQQTPASTTGQNGRTTKERL